MVTRQATAMSLAESKAMSQLLGCSWPLMLAVPVLAYTFGPKPSPVAVPPVTTARMTCLRLVTVLAGSGVAVTCLACSSRIGWWKLPAATVAATDAMAIGEAVSWPSPNASWASSEPVALDGALK